MILGVDSDAGKGVVASVQEGEHDSRTNPDKLTSQTTKTVIYDGIGTDRFTGMDRDATLVARGFAEVMASGVCVLSPVPARRCCRAAGAVTATATPGRPCRPVKRGAGG